MSKKIVCPPFRDVHPFDKVYLPLHLSNIIPELGSTLGYCIEAMSIPVKTAEDPYAPKTSLQRAGQYLKVQCEWTSSAPIKKAEREVHVQNGV